jgi:hypothetical protein
MPLDPEIAAHLARQRRQPPRSVLDVAGTREMMRRTAALAGAAPPLSRVEDVVLPRSLRVGRSRLNRRIVLEAIFGMVRLRMGHE